MITHAAIAVILKDIPPESESFTFRRDFLFFIVKDVYKRQISINCEVDRMDGAQFAKMLSDKHLFELNRMEYKLSLIHILTTTM